MLFDGEFLRRLEKLEIILKKAVTANFQGQHISVEPGTGLEFNDYRQYMPGDDYRYIDWNLYSRLEQLFLKLFTEEKEMMLYFLIDNSKSMGFGEPEKLITALKMAAALGYIGLANYDKVGAGFFSDSLNQQFRPAKGKNRVNSFFSFLEKSRKQGTTNFNLALKLFNYQFKKPGTIFILSDFLDPEGYQDGLKLLLASNWNIVLIQILCPSEIEPSFQGEFRLIDTETDQVKEINIDQMVIEKYQKNLEEYCDNLRQFAWKYGITYHKLSSDNKFEDIIAVLTKKETTTGI